VRRWGRRGRKEWKGRWRKIEKGEGRESAPLRRSPRSGKEEGTQPRSTEGATREGEKERPIKREGGRREG
jgi:hypothetical protein